MPVAAGTRTRAPADKLMADPLLSFLTLLAGPEPDERLLEVRYRTNGRPGMGQHFISACAPIAASELIRPLCSTRRHLRWRAATRPRPRRP